MSTILHKPTMNGLNVKSISSDGTYLVGVNEKFDIEVYAKHKGNYEFHSKIVGLQCYLSNDIAITNELLLVSANTQVFTDRVVHVFVRNGVKWEQQGVIRANNDAWNDAFGISINISDDSNTVFIGVSNKEHSCGGVYVFTRVENTWNYQALLTVCDESSKDYFGYNVIPSNDGNKANVFKYEPDKSQLVNYLFVRTGDTWVQQEKMIHKTMESYQRTI